MGVDLNTALRYNITMDLDSKGLGRLQHVANARDVWTSEAGDFTPWLAENLDVLANELGMNLTLVSIEVPVGQFRLDIQATRGDGHVVIIENQLERTDHAHLGQLLSYASGLEATTVVWVAPTFREEHRRTLDWLNERTDTGVEFFGVEITVVQIGETGPRAPVFTVVARPNSWQKDVRERTGMPAAPAPITPLNAQRQDVFAEILAGVNAARPAIRIPARSNANWIAFASGPFGYWSLTGLPDGRVRIEAFLDSGDGTINKALFDEMAADALTWDQRAGVPLSWERLDAQRSSRIATYSEPVELTDPEARAHVKQWATDALIGLHDALNTTLRNRAKQLRTLTVSQDENDYDDTHGSANPDSPAPEPTSPEDSTASQES
ncbi:DUF4268 domain-containing protein [Acidothermaceae bacterium B102]|nr:DUF4268 domain-containing protein [Acidothermaceae bacterium B102]